MAAVRYGAAAERAESARPGTEAHFRLPRGNCSGLRDPPARLTRLETLRLCSKRLRGEIPAEPGNLINQVVGTHCLVLAGDTVPQRVMSHRY